MPRLWRTHSPTTSEGKDTELKLRLTWHFFKQPSSLLMERVVKGDKNVKTPNWNCVLSVSIYTHLVHNVDGGRISTLKALSSAS